MNEAFIWLSGLRFKNNNKLLMARNFFWIFTENKPVRGLRKKYNIPDVNWLKERYNFDNQIIKLTDYYQQIYLV